MTLNSILKFLMDPEHGYYSSLNLEYHHVYRGSLLNHRTLQHKIDSNEAVRELVSHEVAFFTKFVCRLCCFYDLQALCPKAN